MGGSRVRQTLDYAARLRIQDKKLAAERVAMLLKDLGLLNCAASAAGNASE
jgi:ABC-type multidrug transport system ATPase subunit